jgi:hypothetical protein
MQALVWLCVVWFGASYSNWRQPDLFKHQIWGETSCCIWVHALFYNIYSQNLDWIVMTSSLVAKCLGALQYMWIYSMYAGWTTVLGKISGDKPNLQHKKTKFYKQGPSVQWFPTCSTLQITENVDKCPIWMQDVIHLNTVLVLVKFWMLYRLSSILRTCNCKS